MMASRLRTVTLLIIAGIAASAPQALATDHSGVITTNQSWLAADNPHVVTANVIVNPGVTLTIEAGAMVRVVGGRNLTIRGHLSALGTVGAPIVFTREATASWSGLYVENAGTANLAHCTVEYANFGIYHSSSGAVTITNATVRFHNYGIRANDGPVNLASTTITDCEYYGIHGDGVAPTLNDDNVVILNSRTGVYLTDVPGANLTTPMTIANSTLSGLTLVNCSNATLDNLVLTGNGGTNGAILIDDAGDFTLGGGNTITGNSWPLSLTMGSYPSAASVIPASGNTNNAIQVTGGASTRSGSWRPFPGVVYAVRGNPSISAGGSLTITAGTTVRFGTNNNMVVQGTLTAAGTAGAGVLFTRDGASNWNGLIFQTSGTGHFTHCTIEFAATGINANSTQVINISDVIMRSNNQAINTLSGTVNLLHAQIVDNIQYGIRVTGGTVVFGESEAEWNDIHGNGGSNQGRDIFNDTGAEVIARYVYWGTSDWTVIEGMIWDNHDDADCGLVAYVPFTTAGHEGTLTAAPATAPATLVLAANAPNPFNPATVITFDLPTSSPVQLAIFDVRGHLVRTLVDQPLAAGHHEVRWDGRDGAGREMPSAVYVSRLWAAGQAATGRMTLAR